ncbi:unnamed protein product, partial [Phytomonas sp. Hart1]
MSTLDEDTNEGTSQSSTAGSPRNRRRHRRLRRHAAPAGGLSDPSDAVSEREDDPEDGRPPLVPIHSKPRVITEALFIWETVASFCEPQLVCELERLSRDVAAHLARSNTGTRLLQRYWHAQWRGLVWPDPPPSLDLRLLRPASLPRCNGRVRWKQSFVEEYPLWLQRTIMGKGKNDRAYDASKVLFHRETLNLHKSADELAATELTVEEALQKAIAKRGIEVGMDEKGDPKELLNTLKRRGQDGVRSNGTASPRLVKGLSCLNLCSRSSQESLTREDYQMDHRQGSRKGKHKKGLDKKWSSYDNFGDFDY